MENRFQDLFNTLKNNRYQVANSTYKDRIKKLLALKKAIEVTYRQDIRDALFKDFGKPQLEVDLTEIYPIISEIKHAKKHLKFWMGKQPVNTPLSLLGASSYVQHEPKGVCLIMAPWNFPLNLLFCPLVSAIAAGNVVVLKPSEMTHHISKVMKTLVEHVFSPNEVVVIEGDVTVAEELLKLPFDHIFFTGSPQVGKLVMKAASQHLTSVTLELGGKSPSIVDASANIKDAVNKTAFGKFLNAGQTCIAPDYVLVHNSIKTRFVEAFKTTVAEFYSIDPESSTSYCRIVNERHFNRLLNHLEDAKSKGAQIEFGGEYNQENCFLSPTLVTDLPENASLFNEEIFGPILPIIGFDSLEEAVAIIQAKEKPLALYMFSKNKKHIDFIMKHTSAGGTCINHNLAHFLNNNLPFGGVNFSGLGKTHGVYGFEAFSNKRAVLKQHTKGTIDLLYPPYTGFKEKLVKWTVKWF